MHIVFVNYTYSGECRGPEDWMRKIAAHVPLLEALATEAKVSYVTRIGWEGAFESGNVQYYFTAKGKGGQYFPVAMHRQIRQLLPDKVIVAGLHYPFQVLQLQRSLGKHCKVYARHHADKPFTGFRRWIQQQADRIIDGYLFTSDGNAAEWLHAGIISAPRKVVELPATAPAFQRMSKAEARRKTGISGQLVFIWAGRLEMNKDPLTVVQAFCAFARTHPEASLYMIFQTNELQDQIERICEENPYARVVLKGKVPYEEMSAWFSAADLFVSGSHREGGSYALLEAMACGCVPIVTEIAPALKVISGKGFSYPAGDVNALHQCMLSATGVDITLASAEAEQHFLENYTVDKLAGALLAL